MAAFSAVNAKLPVPASEDRQMEEAATPSTPKPEASAPEQLDRDAHDGESTPNTPTRHSFGGVLGQRPLPNSALEAPDTPGKAEGTTAVKRDASHLEDVEMGDADNGENAEDDGSDDESVDGDGQRSSKKKKGQRFFCTEFPPCQLSFTRSEHLARHIRKHTGERPFQCHCSRRFSRLDNLRQHAQTVHVNEEIPAESLAATSTRFQRQIRTDRVRPTTSRSRASTLGSSAGSHRGHGRNLSTSSIGSTTSSLGGDDDYRRRPQPLAMAGSDLGARARLSLESYNTVHGSAGQQHIYQNQSSSGYSTPTSAAYSTGAQSPRFPSGMTSPGSALSRNSYYNGARHSRRLSVPSSAAHPFQAPHLSYHQPPYFNAPLSGTSTSFSPTSSSFASPTSSVFSHGRRESESEMEYRRRTWHPSSNSQYAQRPATSGLTYHQTPDEPRPAFTQQQAASQMTRLPGIESFDHAPPPGIRPPPPPLPDAAMPDASPRPMSSSRELQQGLTRLDITAANAPMEGHWQAHQTPHPSQLVYHQQGPPHTAQYIPPPKHVSMPEPPVTPRKVKRNAWYGGPITAGQAVSGPGQPYVIHRPSPEDSGSSDGVPTPSISQVSEYNPVIVNPTGLTEYPPPGTAVTTDEHKVYYNPSSHVQHKSDRIRTDSGYQQYQPHANQPAQTYALQAGHDPRFPPQHYAPPPINEMSKLDALVAVATSEGNRGAEPRS